MEDKIYIILQKLMSKKIDHEIGLHQEDFEEIVKTFNMKCKYSISNINGSNLIVENWYSDINPFISLNRVLDINSDNLSKISPKKRKSLLQKILENEVESENYEQAAIIRDLISEISE